MGTFLVVVLCLVLFLIWLFSTFGNSPKADPSSANKSARQPSGIASRAPPASIRISYVDAVGNQTERDIAPYSSGNTNQRFRAWCYLRNEQRDFLFERIRSATDIHTGNSMTIADVFSRVHPGRVAPVWMRDTDGREPLESDDPVDAYGAPRFKVVVRSRGHPEETLEVTPAAWGSHRREMQGISFPDKEIVFVPFADVHEAIDLATGEMFGRVGFWKEVLAHREDDPPWYVRFADQHLMVLCLVGFVRQELGQFKAAMRPQVNFALQSVGYVPLDDDGFKSIIQSVSSGYNGHMTLRTQVDLLTADEKRACKEVARTWLGSKSMDLQKADQTFAS